MTVSPTRLEKERRRRIRVAVAAYAYEVFHETVMPDADYDRMAAEIMPTFKTGHPVMDEFFATQFDPSTGVWVHKHPEPAGLLRVLREVHGIGLEEDLI